MKPRISAAMPCALGVSGIGCSRHIMSILPSELTLPSRRFMRLPVDIEAEPLVAQLKIGRTNAGERTAVPPAKCITTRSPRVLNPSDAQVALFSRPNLSPAFSFERLLLRTSRLAIGRSSTSPSSYSRRSVHHNSTKQAFEKEATGLAQAFNNSGNTTPSGEFYGNRVRNDSHTTDQNPRENTSNKYDVSSEVTATPDEQTPRSSENRVKGKRVQHRVSAKPKDPTEHFNKLFRPLSDLQSEAENIETLEEEIYDDTQSEIDIKQRRRPLKARDQWHDTLTLWPPSTPLSRIERETWRFREKKLRGVMTSEATAYRAGRVPRRDEVWSVLLSTTSSRKDMLRPATFTAAIRLAAAVQIQDSPELRSIITAVHDVCNTLTPAQTVGLLGELSRLRIRDEALLRHLAHLSLKMPFLSVQAVIRVANAVATLGLSHHEEALPVKAALKNKLQLRALSVRDLLHSVSPITIMELFDNDMTTLYLSDMAERLGRIADSRPVALLKTNLIELFLRLCEPLVYTQLPPDVKQFLHCSSEASATLLRSPENHLRDDAERRSAIQKASDMLSEQIGKQTVLTDVRAGPLHVDIYCPNSKRAFQIDSPQNYYQGTDLRTAKCKCYQRLLEKMGFEVMWVWPDQSDERDDWSGPNRRGDSQRNE